MSKNLGWGSETGSKAQYRSCLRPHEGFGWALQALQILNSIESAWSLAQSEGLLHELEHVSRVPELEVITSASWEGGARWEASASSRTSPI